MQAIINVSEELFHYLFKATNNFTHEGLGVLYHYLESQEEEGKPQNLNVVDLCMKYSEERLKDFCLRRNIPTTYDEPLDVDVDVDGETIYYTHALNKDELTDNVLEYFRESDELLIGFTGTTVLYG